MASCIVLGGAQVNHTDLIGAVLHQLCQLGGADVVFAVGLLGSLFVVIFNRRLDVCVYRIGLLAEGGRLGGHQAGSSLLFGDAVVKAAADIDRLFACQVEQEDGLGCGLAAVAVDINGLVGRDFVQSRRDIDAVWNVDCALNVASCVVLSGTDVQNDRVLAVSNRCQEGGGGNLILVVRQVCKVALYLGVEELLGGVFDNAVTGAQPAGAAFSAHAAGEVVGFQAHHSGDGNGLGSSLTAVALEDDLLILRQVCQRGFHTLSERDVLFCTGDAGLQVVIFGTQVDQVVIVVLQHVFDRLGAHVEAAVLSCNGVVLDHGLLDVLVHRIGLLAEGGLFGGHQAGSSLLLGDAVIKAAADIVGVLARQVEQGDGLGSGLTAVAVNQNRDIVRNFIEALCNRNAVRNVDCALDVASCVILSGADVQHADVLASRYALQQVCRGDNMLVRREVGKVCRRLLRNGQLLPFLLLGCDGFGTGFRSINRHACADAHRQNQRCNNQLGTDIISLHFHDSYDLSVWPQPPCSEAPALFA